MQLADNVNDATSTIIGMHSGCMKGCVEGLNGCVTKSRRPTSRYDACDEPCENWRELTQQVCFALLHGLDMTCFLNTHSSKHRRQPSLNHSVSIRGRSPRSPTETRSEVRLTWTLTSTHVLWHLLTSTESRNHQEAPKQDYMELRHFTYWTSTNGDAENFWQGRRPARGRIFWYGQNQWFKVRFVSRSWKYKYFI